jgi:hypothetical protein
MTGFLSRIAARSVGAAPALTPRPLSIFEPEPASFDTGLSTAPAATMPAPSATVALPAARARAAAAVVPAMPPMREPAMAAPGAVPPAVAVQPVAAVPRMATVGIGRHFADSLPVTASPASE